MAAATDQRVKTERLDNNSQSAPMLTNVEIFAGTIVMLNSSGLARPGATATGCVGAGVARTRSGLPSWDNNPGASGAITVEYDEGVFGPFDNSGTSIAAGDESKPCYIVDDQTVHLTDGSGTRSPAGRIHSVTSAGVYVDISANLSREIAESQIVSTGSAYTQTYSTANRTVANPTGVAPNAATAAALTDNGGGAAADGTIAAITNAANAGSADVGPTADAIKELSDQINKLITDVASIRTQVTALVADDLDNRQTLSAIIDDLQTADIVD